MKPINEKTKIAHLIKAHPDALEAIVSIHPKFKALKNPGLRREIAGRATIYMASKIAGCGVEAFYEKLQPLGFEIDTIIPASTKDKKKLPAFITALRKNQIIDFDVRELLASGEDPLQRILDRVKSIQEGEALKIINTFEPVPLIKILEKQGFEVFSDEISEQWVETYFFKKSTTNILQTPTVDESSAGWDTKMQIYTDKLISVDVRPLEMPQPMVTILEALDTLPSNFALHVYHKRIPVFLLPELSERNFDYRIKEISDGEVQLLIFSN